MSHLFFSTSILILAINSLTASSSALLYHNVFDNARNGGGVLELEPNEAERLPLPLIGANALDLEELDKLLRQGNISTVLDITDEVLLIKGMGLSSEETSMLRVIWQKLRDRRVNRNHGTSKRHTQTDKGEIKESVIK